MEVVIFDLDGTLSDPAEGIAGSINYALEAMGYDCYRPDDLLRFIGPPLDHTFRELLDTDDAEILMEAVQHYREHSIKRGFAQNKLYPGIFSMLERLKSCGHVLYIATQKPQNIAVQVVEHFGIASFFTKVLGCGLRSRKADLLQRILSEGYLLQDCIMVGDRDSDFQAAGEVGMRSVAVTWGYGNESEYAIATYRIDTPDALCTLVEISDSDVGGSEFVF